MTTAELDTALRDSVLLESCKTEAELSYACRNIEARHAVEGISDIEQAAWEAVKAAHVRRVYRVALQG